MGKPLEERGTNVDLLKLRVRGLGIVETCEQGRRRKGSMQCECDSFRPSSLHQMVVNESYTHKESEYTQRSACREALGSRPSLWSVCAFKFWQIV